jgi:gliding motility-associated-like protein
LANPQNTTTYHVTGTDSLGCSASDSVTVQVKQPIKLSVISSDTLCLGASVQLNASPGAEIYNWQPTADLNNPNIQNPVATPSAPGNITYTVTGKDDKNCFTDTASVTLMVSPFPQFNIVDSTVVSGANGSYVIRTINSPDIISWQWSPATNLSCTNCAEPVATVGTTIQYTGTATNVYGCSSSDKITIKGTCSSNLIFVPNTFSPNGDNVNDHFYPRGQGLYIIRSMRIFNRLGQMVFEKTNFAPESESEGWDGRFHSKNLPSDVYVYFIEAICNNGLVVKFKGDITLLR